MRQLAGTSAAACGLSLLPTSIQKALATPPANTTGTIADVKHVVILMQENRSFDHYFGTMSGVRGFGDRSAIPLPSGKKVWFQSDGKKEVLPFHLDTHATRAMRIRGTPHSWVDAHQAWDNGRLSEWPRFKQARAMGYYEADDIPFQRALASAFTICDAHHCSIQTGTLANRAVFMAGTNVRPGLSGPANSRADAFIDNGSNRGAKYGHYDWSTYPERLQEAGISWRIYQDPRENWGGLLAPWEAFAAYANSVSGEPLYENAMSRWTLEAFGEAVANGTLPQVSWIIPPPVWSEHPAESSPVQGAAFTRRVIDYLTANPEIWSQTVLIVTFDENDGFFDHAPPPAPPTIDAQGVALGGSTLSDSDMQSLYYRDEMDGVMTLRPYGLGPRVPMYIVSPWSRGGWVCSEVFDHTSTIRFLEARFGVHEPNISAWHRAVSGDLTSCFDFMRPTLTSLPEMPDLGVVKGEKLVLDHLPQVEVPAMQQVPSQDPGVRFSRALPYRLAIETDFDFASRALIVRLQNTGSQGAVFHLYNRLDLVQPPRRFTVEAAKSLSARWDTRGGEYDIHIVGPNGSFWRLAGEVPTALDSAAQPQLRLRADAAAHQLMLEAWNTGSEVCEIAIKREAYYTDPETSLELMPGATPALLAWTVEASGFWYDFSVTSTSDERWKRRFAGRLETGRHGITDPALGGLPQVYCAPK